MYPGFSGTWSVDQADLELKDLPVSPFWMLGLKANPTFMYILITQWDYLLRKKNPPTMMIDSTPHACAHTHTPCIIFLCKKLANSGLDWLWVKLTDWTRGKKTRNSKIKEYFLLFVYVMLEIELMAFIIVVNYSRIKAHPSPVAANVLSFSLSI